MSKKLQFNQCLHSQFKGTFYKSSVQRLGLLFASSAFLVLALPAIDLPGSKLLAQNVVSQDLDAAMFYQQGVTRYNRKDLQGAESAFRQALQRDSNIGLARNYLGNILMEQNRLDLAVQEYGEAVRLIPNFGEAYYNLGLALQKQEQKEAAITAYRQALVINPTMASAHYNLGLLLYEQELREEAIASYQRAINLDSSNVNAYLNLAIALQQEGQTEQAISNYRQVLKLDPKNTVAYNNLGSLLVIQGQPSEAIAVYQQAIRQNTKNALAYYNLGVTLYNQGNLKEANQAFKRARQEYGQQGNTEQTSKIDEMTQKISQYLAPKKPEVNQTTTPTPSGDVVLPPPEQATPVNPTNEPNTFQLQLPQPEQMPTEPTNSNSNQK
ncbi:tetratricopeptide repeat protein [Anabaena sphaerica FACHB-251]|uniref:Tetratricopeptide repeat protein n=1 Tax=Anabaena sphaerica FACHB-251 TaxID=2692883 RepID=A0A926WN86_9NOST|nr:tetratricopeptide repeat protein [Anabaena sphaerica]MBD2296546.1 tetratricopeptide repeat protein [Anabaena sphaerica FACHB-251]